LEPITLKATKLGDKDLKFRLKISKKEAKEVAYWLKLFKEMNKNEEDKIETLIKEANEMRRILS
jgi:four helix bundle protein